MSATFRILEHRVGEGALNRRIEVRRIQQLLRLNGFNVQANGTWHSGTTDALVKFQEKIRNPTEVYYNDDLGPPRKSIDPHDKILFELAYGAGVLIMLAPGGHIYRHAIAFEDVHKWCVKERIPFDMRHRAVWGFDQFFNWAIVTEFDQNFGGHTFALDVPRALNCTLYANLMMSVWKQGNAHGYPFSASVRHAGGDTHFARDRYNYPLIGKFSSAEDIDRMTHRHPQALYCLEFGRDQVGHMGLLYMGRVYECNYGPTRDVHSITLAHWVSTHPSGWVLGPAPL